MVAFPRVKKWDRVVKFPASASGGDMIELTKASFSQWREKAFNKAGLGQGKSKSMKNLYSCLHHFPQGPFRGKKMVFGATPSITLLEKGESPRQGPPAYLLRSPPSVAESPTVRLAGSRPSGTQRVHQQPVQKPGDGG